MAGYEIFRIRGRDDDKWRVVEHVPRLDPPFAGARTVADFISRADAIEYVDWKSAGNPQAGKVQISEAKAAADAAIVAMNEPLAYAEPERSDGRIQAPIGDEAELGPIHRAEAQRSVGRVEAGSVTKR